MKKFLENDLLTSTLKVYPKVKIFVHNGNVYYNKSAESGPKLNNFLFPISVEVSEVPAGAITNESSEPLLTESGEYIVIE